jgi:hypothetical protein
VLSRREKLISPRIRPFVFREEKVREGRGGRIARRGKGWVGVKP